MNTEVQSTLFDGSDLVTAPTIDPRTLTGRTDPSTSAEAIEHLDATGGLSRQRMAVLEALRQYGPCTAVELERESGLSQSLLCKRLPELRRMHLAESLEPRVCRVRGSRMQVWRAT